MTEKQTLIPPPSAVDAIVKALADIATQLASLFTRMSSLEHQDASLYAGAMHHSFPYGMIGYGVASFLSFSTITAEAEGLLPSRCFYHTCRWFFLYRRPWSYLIESTNKSQLGTPAYSLQHTEHILFTTSKQPLRPVNSLCYAGFNFSSYWNSKDQVGQDPFYLFVLNCYFFCSIDLYTFLIDLVGLVITVNFLRVA